MLQVYGITPTSLDFQERLNGTIQRKLEATTLDIFCGVYTRNQQLKLAPEDVTFLQPDFRKPSLTLHLPLPAWLGPGYRQTFFFYFLQMLSTFTLYPVYSSADMKEHYQFQAHGELQEAYLMDGLDSENTSDHLLLYLRPQNKGRGMAVLCVSLADPEGRVIGPLLGRTLPLKFEDSYLVRLEEECAVNECLVSKGTYCIKLHVWEKGNIGIEEFMHRLSVSYKQSMYDYFLEVYLLPSPMTWGLPPTDPENRSPDLTGGVLEEKTDGYTAEVMPPPSAADMQGPHKKESVVSFEAHASNFSRQSSEDLSRRGSEHLSRHGPESLFRSESFSACLSERSSHQGGADNMFCRGSENSARLSSGRGSQSSTRKHSLAYSESRRTSGDHGVCARLDKVSQTLCSWRQDQLGHDDVIDEAQEMEHLLDVPITSPGPGGQEEVGGAGGKVGRKSQQEGLVKRRRQGSMEARADLSRVYSTTIPAHLAMAQQAACPSVRYTKLSLLGHHSTLVFVSQASSILVETFPKFSFSVYQHMPYGYVRYLAEKDWTQVSMTAAKTLQETSFLIIGHNPAQWEYCASAGQTAVVAVGTAPESSQLFSGVDSKNTAFSCQRTPLQRAAVGKEVFVPRRRMVFLRVTQRQVRLRQKNKNDILEHTHLYAF